MSDCKEITAAELREWCECAARSVSLNGFVDAETCAEILDISERTLRLWRSHDRGPPWRKPKHGRAVKYALADIAAWFNEQCRQEAASSGSHRQRPAGAP
jgi:hypothetical protein